MNVRVIGLTGGIASGKSSVLRWLLAQGCQALDADLLSREVVEPGQAAWEKIVAVFGEEILLEDRRLNRKLLGDRIFSDAGLRETLNSIVHPAVISQLEARAEEKRSGGITFPPLILDIPLLFEADLSGLADQNWLVYVRPEVQLRRLMERDGIDTEAAGRRIAAQWPLEQKRVLAHRVIDNSGEWVETVAQLRSLWQEL